MMARDIRIPLPSFFISMFFYSYFIFASHSPFSEVILTMDIPFTFCNGIEAT